MESLRKLEFGQEVELDATGVVAVPLECLPLEAKLDFSIFIKLADGFTDQFVQFRSPGDHLTSVRLSTLQSRVDCAFVPKGSWAQLVESVRTAESKSRSVSALELQGTCIRNLIWTLLKDSEEKRELFPNVYSELKTLSERFSNGIMKLPFLRRALIKRYRDVSLYFSNHSVNVSMYAMGIAHELALPPADMQVLVQACLLHNLGCLSIPTEVIGKEGSLVKEEWQYVRSHPYRGTRMLEKLKAPKEVVLTALQHHERLDGSGYPSETLGPEIHLYAKICAVADVFDAIQSLRPYHTGDTKHKARETITRLKGQLDSKLVDCLIRTEKD